mmetsp:Transcript_21999/g.56033  ORF Transcript_21999/g.56033 Transcript_21999/m.56033 type:complete len:224 (-) Transcript_21999:339-1010(-)
MDALNLVTGWIVPTLHSTWPRCTSSRLRPRRRRPTLSPASPESSSLWNISTPVHVVFCVSLYPTISISSPTLMLPLSMRPVTTVPRPAIECVPSTGMRKSLSVSRFGVGIVSSTAAIRAITASLPILSSRPSSAQSAEPCSTGTSSPGNSCRLSSSRTSISTSSSSSSSSTWSHLFRKTTSAGMPTCLASSTCSRVCGIGPSGAETTRMAPSIVAAPVIMFFT